MTTLETQIEYFKQHRADFVKEHHGKFVLIHGQMDHGFYDTALDAHTAAMKDKVSPGTFLIRQCLAPEEETVPVFHSRVA